MTPAQARASAETRRVVAAIFALGGTATIAAVAHHAGMTRQRVMRRLCGSGPSTINPHHCYFTCDRGSGLWGLTTRGRAWLEEPCPTPT